MLVTPEIATIIASAVGLLGLIVKKARCFARRVNGRWSYGAGFTEGRLIPEIKQDINIQMGYQPSPTVTGVSSDPTPLSSWRRALKLPADGLSNRK